MTRYAIYARYSSDLQSENSIEDQIRLCRDNIARLGGTVAEVYTDAAISGASTINRPGIRALMEDAKFKRFDRVYAEALDRISRDQEDIAGIYKRLSHNGISIFTSAEGEVSELHIGLKGTMNAIFLKDLAAKVKRGHRGRLAVKRAAGGLAYGYRAVFSLDGRGQVERGQREIEPDQAAIVKRIFREFADGRSGRMIAAGLNRDGIPSPRGGLWIASAINGNRRRHSGILYNDLYIGQMVYNRQSFFKDPDTGRRIPRVNPRSEWQIVDVPELRIIDDALWQSVQQLKARIADKPLHAAKRPKHLLSGLIRCGICGGGYTIADKDKLRCATRRESGEAACTNGQGVSRGEIETRILTGLEAQLMEDAAFAYYVQVYREARAQLRAEAAGRMAACDRAYKAASDRISRIVNAIAEGTDTPALRAQLVELEGQVAQYRAAERVPSSASNVVEITPNLAQAYAKQVANLRQALNGPSASREAAVEALRAIVSEVRVKPGEKRGEVLLELCGSIPSILAFAQGNQPKNHPVMLVATEGFEPPTKGL